MWYAFHTDVVVALAVAVVLLPGVVLRRFSFVVVPNAFIIHQPHAPSLDIARYRASAMYRECLKVFKSDFLRYLSRKYGIRALKYLTPDT